MMLTECWYCLLPIPEYQEDTRYRGERYCATCLDHFRIQDQDWPVSGTCEFTVPFPSPDGRALCWDPSCRKPLEGRQKKWCLDHGAGGVPEWYRQHDWGYARPLALKLVEVWFDELNRWLYPCRTCGSMTDRPEVDHIVPMNGASRSGKDCRNHQSNLQVLCHACHVDKTAQQMGWRTTDETAEEESEPEGLQLSLIDAPPPASQSLA